MIFVLLFVSILVLIRIDDRDKDRDEDVLWRADLRVGRTRCLYFRILSRGAREGAKGFAYGRSPGDRSGLRV